MFLQSNRKTRPNSVLPELLFLFVYGLGFVLFACLLILEFVLLFGLFVCGFGLV